MISQAEVIEVLKMQSILNGAICMLVALIGAAGSYGSYFVIKSGLKNVDADTKRWMVTSGAILGVISISIFCVFFWLGLTRVANPGMQAIEYLLKNQQGKLL